MGELVDPTAETQSQASGARRVNASRAAQRQLREQTGRRSRQVETLRADLERKLTRKQELQEELAQARDETAGHKDSVKDLREKKLVYRVFKSLDSEGLRTVSPDNLRSVLDAADASLVEAELFGGLPTTVIAHVRAADFDPAAVQARVAEAVGAPAEAVAVDVPDGQYSGAVEATVRLLWHAPPEHLRGPGATAQRDEYFQALGGELTPSDGAKKDAELHDCLAGVLEELEYEVRSIGEERRASFDDFVEQYWRRNVGADGSPSDDVPHPLRALYSESLGAEQGTVLPEDALDRITELEQAIALQQKANNDVRKNTGKVHNDISAIDKKIAQLSKELTHIKSVTGYHRTGTAGVEISKAAVDMQTKLAQVDELETLIKRLREEKVKGENIVRKKTQLIQELVREHDEKKEAEEGMYGAVNDVKVATKEVQDLRDQLARLKRGHQSSDRAIVKAESQRDTGAIDSLNLDRTYLKQQIGKHKDVRGTQEKVVSTQMWRIDTLHNRIAVCEDALRDLKLELGGTKGELIASELDDTRDPCNLDDIQPKEGEEKVDVVLYELLCRDLFAIEDASRMKQVLLQEKEATIEATKEKVETLELSNQQDEQYHAGELWQQRDELEAMARQGQEDHVTAREKEGQARRERQDALNARLRKAKTKQSDA